MQIYMMPLRLDPKFFTGTTVMFLAVTNVLTLIPYAAAGGGGDMAGRLGGPPYAGQHLLSPHLRLGGAGRDQAGLGRVLGSGHGRDARVFVIVLHPGSNGHDQRLRQTHRRGQ